MNRLRTRTIWTWSIVGDAPRCGTCGIALGSLPWLPPYQVELEMWGEESGDIAFGPGPDLLVSERFASWWNREELLGLAGFDPVRVERVISRSGSKAKVPNYFRVEVLRSRVAVDEDASEIVREGDAPCATCRIGGVIQRARRIVLKSPDDDGLDVFFARGLPGVILTSQRFKSFCVEREVRNAVIVPAGSHGLDYYPGDE